MGKQAVKAIIIGGSAGSMPVIMQILETLPRAFLIPVIIIIHRQRNFNSEMTRILAAAHPYKNISEPDDKDPIKESHIYLAPQNYHLLIEKDESFSLDYSEPIQFSRPSIDVTMESAASVFKDRLVAVLLSGANTDGTAGLQKVVQNEGIGVVQDPSTAEFETMPRSAVANCKGVQVMKPESISAFLNRLINNSLMD
jgi:two-component system chemotaxis response regulator CheB